jgi:uncharacterized membrane protein
MLKAKDFRAQARAALKGKWKHAVIAGLIAGILGGTVLYRGYANESASGPATDAGTAALSLEIILATIALILIIGVFTFLIGSIVGLGYAKFNLELYKNETADFKMVFSEKSRYKDCFKLFFMQFLYVTIGSILFVIPGIIAFYGNIMGAFIMVENPEMSAKEALAASRAMMKGNKWRLFCLSWSCIGWDILAALSMGVGHLFLCPYVEAAAAAFYNEIKAGK